MILLTKWFPLSERSRTNARVSVHPGSLDRGAPAVRLEPRHASMAAGLRPALNESGFHLAFGDSNSLLIRSRTGPLVTATRLQLRPDLGVAVVYIGAKLQRTVGIYKRGLIYHEYRDGCW